MAVLRSIRVSVSLVLVVLLAVSAIPLYRQARQISNDEVTVRFVLVLDRISSCSTGLSHREPFLYLEFRLITRNTTLGPGPWWRVLVNDPSVFISDDASDGFHCISLMIPQVPFPENTHFIQFRMVQPEHGGGNCNCWGLSNFRISLPDESVIPIEQYCDHSGTTFNSTITDIAIDSDISEDCSAYLNDQTLFFCNGSASVPRGVVSVPFLRNLGTSKAPCEEIATGSYTVDPRDRSPTDGCADTQPRIELKFKLNLLNNPSRLNPCRGAANFDEGVEVAMGNWDNDGQWIPLKFYAPSTTRSPPNHNIDIGHFSDTINIRGYKVPFSVSSSTRSFNVSLSVCGEEFIRDGVQFRWLQTTSFNSMANLTNVNNWRDVWTLDDVSVTLHLSEAHSTTLLEDNFNRQSEVNASRWNAEIRNGIISDRCDRDFPDENALVFGAICTTVNCGSGKQITASRLASTASLNVDSILNMPTELTTPTTTIAMTTITTPEPTTEIVLDEYEVQAIQELDVTLQDVLDVIENDTILQEVQSGSLGEDANLLLDVVMNRSVVDPTVVAYLLSIITNRSTNVIKNISQDVLSIGNILLEAAVDMAKEEPNTIAGSTLLMVFEELTLGIANRNLTQILSQIHTVMIADQADEDLYQALDIEDHFIHVPYELLRYVHKSGSVTLGSYFYRDLSGFLPGNMTDRNDTQLASPVISTALLCGDSICITRNRPLNNSVSITIPHSKHVQALIEADNSSEVFCVFWEFITSRNSSGLVSGRWDTDGCVRNDNLSDSTQTVCECSHLTNFAILLSAKPLPTVDRGTTIPPIPTTPTTPMDPDSVFELEAQQDLMDTLQNVLDMIGNDTELGNILKEPPAEAVQSLEGVVNDRAEVDETVVAFLLTDIINRTDSDLDDTLSFSKSILTVGNEVLKMTKELEEDEEPSTIAGSTILTAFETLAFELLEDMDTPDQALPQIESRLRMIQVEDDEDDDDVISGIDTEGHSIELPNELLRLASNGSGPITVGSYFYRNMSGLLPGSLPRRNDTELASPVLSTALQCGNKRCKTRDMDLKNPVTITIQHLKNIKARLENDNTSEVMCVFWEFITASDGGGGLVSGRWDTDGCVRNDNLSDSTQTVCECTHLTNFAILLSARPLPLDSAVALSLSIIGYIGVSLSVVAMLVTIGVLSFLKSLWSMRNFIHINLCVSLILAQLTFVIGVTPYGGGGVNTGCKTVAVLMHYLFLVSFMWMLMEGVVLYVVLVRVFIKFQRRYMIGFFIASYGLPLLYMALCVPLGFALRSEPDYGYIQQVNETAMEIPNIVCWLNPYTNFILTFIVPVVVIILVNIGFFIMALAIMYRHSKRQTHKSTVESSKHWIKGTISLVVVMGFTWLFGVLVFEVEVLLPLAYIFTICAAFQGVAIFVIFVLLSKQVREAYSKWWKVKVAESDILSKHFGEFSTSAMTSSRNNASSPNTMNRGTSSSALETSVVAKEALEMEALEQEIKRASALVRQGTSFDITYLPEGSLIEKDQFEKNGEPSTFVEPETKKDLDEHYLENGSTARLTENGHSNGITNIDSEPEESTTM